jgi:hypothetical protein
VAQDNSLQNYITLIYAKSLFFQLVESLITPDDQFGDMVIEMRF